MNPNIVTVSAEDDQEEVARLIAKYDLLALPVLCLTPERPYGPGRLEAQC